MNYLIEYAIIVIFLSILSIGFYLSFFYKKRKKISHENIIKFRKILKEILNNKLKSNKEKILDLDKLYHKILLSVQYNWTFGEILKQNPNLVKNIDKVWELHKLRNKIAHEFYEIEETLLINKVKEYTYEINEILK